MPTVRPGDPRVPQATALLQQSHALMQSLFPVEANHFLSLDALCGPDVRFFVACEGEAILGTGALRLFDGFGEVKSMFVAPAARGLGLARALLRRIEIEARAEGQPRLCLETGDSLHAAHALYRSHGFVDRGPFGDYTASPYSVFMEKPLI